MRKVKALAMNDLHVHKISYAYFFINTEIRRIYFYASELFIYRHK